MDGGLCLCDTCCSEDASEAFEDLPPQSSAQNTKQREEKLDEKYSQRCANFMETEDYEALKKFLDQGDDFFRNEFRQGEKRKSGRIADDEYEVTGTKLEEMKERGGDGSEYYMKCMSKGELGSSSCSDCENADHNNDLREVESVEQENDYQDIGDDDWGYSAEELKAFICENEGLEAAMCEDEELLGSLHGVGGHMMECFIPRSNLKSKRKDRSTALKMTLSSITSSLARFRKRQSSTSRIKPQDSINADAFQRKYDTGQNRAATGVSIKTREYFPTLEISMGPNTEKKLETDHTSRWSSRTEATSSSSGFPDMETNMHMPRDSVQTIPSLSSDMSSDDEIGGRSIHFPAKLPELHRMNIQDNFIKSLISKLTKERREKKLVLRGSRRYRYLATVKRVMDSGWDIQSQVLDKLKRGRKRKLDEQST
ncbi:hypothetical protein BHYA_0161g00080 [Botrytis hyacinthi]|uniref:Uncharacterized protein n=1 Tax=Botrytis hyacinthi TaxID=278943 RepID=A0A4Z1GF47_9HELO|nr:hypothetical protein BHYA_0161g00080 [Botrytis hyacinthi]